VSSLKQLRNGFNRNIVSISKPTRSSGSTHIGDHRPTPFHMGGLRHK
jgi:hypothetical protein